MCGINRKKEGFPMPIGRYLEEINWGRKLLERSTLFEDGLFKQKGIDYFLKRKDIKASYLLLATEVWYRLFIRKQDKAEVESILL